MDLSFKIDDLLLGKKLDEAEVKALAYLKAHPNQKFSEWQIAQELYPFSNESIEAMSESFTGMWATYRALQRLAEGGSISEERGYPHSFYKYAG